MAMTHAGVENDPFFGTTNPQTLVMPEYDHWTYYRWPLYDARVFVDWKFAPQSQTNAFVNFLLKYILVREVTFYPVPTGTVIRIIERNGTKLVAHDIGSNTKREDLYD